MRQKTGPHDLVTEADEAAERWLTEAMGRWFPSAVVIGEEATSADPTRLRLLADADLAIVVDPIDGTSNYAAGLPLFGVMAAVVRRGEVVAAAIHDPVGDDTALALRGEGAWTETPDGQDCGAARCCAGVGGHDDRQCFLAVPAGAPAVQGLCQPASTWRQLGLPMCRTRVSPGGRRTLPFPVLQPADAVGPCAWLAAAS